MKYIFILIIVLFSSCVKEEVVTVEQPQKPIMIKVEAEHTDGQVVTTPIVLVR